MGKFITENKGLIGVLGVCATFIASKIITAKHYERVNEQRIKVFNKYYKGDESTIEERIKNVEAVLED